MEMKIITTDVGAFGRFSVLVPLGLNVFFSSLGQGSSGFHGKKGTESITTYSITTTLECSCMHRHKCVHMYIILT